MKIKPGVGVEAFEEASDGMLVLNENHTIISVNAAFCRLLGCDARGLLGRKAEAVFPREAAFRNDTAIQRLRGDKRLLGGGAAFLVVLPRDAAVVCELHNSSEPKSEAVS